VLIIYPLCVSVCVCLCVLLSTALDSGHVIVAIMFAIPGSVYMLVENFISVRWSVVYDSLLRGVSTYWHMCLCAVIVSSIVSESGASVYSASEEAQKELPDYDVSLRGAGMIQM